MMQIKELWMGFSATNAFTAIMRYYFAFQLIITFPCAPFFIIQPIWIKPPLTRVFSSLGSTTTTCSITHLIYGMATIRADLSFAIIMKSVNMLLI